MTVFLRKLSQKRIWERIFRERLSEPLHLNFVAAFVWLFGGFEAKVYMDLVIRQHNAFGILKAAQYARSFGIREITAVEFGVATGAGLMNMALIAEHVGRATGVKVHVVGFDTGSGMPPPIDYRDHPDIYGLGDFDMKNPGLLRERLPENTNLIIGDIRDTLPDFLDALTPSRPIGYVAIDVDYYSSAMDSLAIFTGRADLYLPETILYFDDIGLESHNEWQGEYLAIKDFNSQNQMRKIGPFNFLRESRLFKRADWINHMYFLHVLDHERKNTAVQTHVDIANPYIREMVDTQDEFFHRISCW